MYVCKYVCMYVCMFVCMYVRITMATYTDIVEEGMMGVTCGCMCMMVTCSILL